MWIRTTQIMHNILTPGRMTRKDNLLSTPNDLLVLPHIPHTPRGLIDIPPDTPSPLPSIGGG